MTTVIDKLSLLDRCKHIEADHYSDGIFVCKGCGLMFADQHSWHMEQKTAKAAHNAEKAA